METLVGVETVNIVIDKQKKVATMQKYNGPSQEIVITVNEDCWIKFDNRDVFGKIYEFLAKGDTPFKAAADLETSFGIYLPDGTPIQMTMPAVPASMVQSGFKRPPWPILP